jgi:hypothetical protein
MQKANNFLNFLAFFYTFHNNAVDILAIGVINLHCCFATHCVFLFFIAALRSVGNHLFKFVNLSSMPNKIILPIHDLLT